MRPDGGPRTIVAVRAPWCWFARPSGGSRALDAVCAPCWRFCALVALVPVRAKKLRAVPNSIRVSTSPTESSNNIPHF